MMGIHKYAVDVSTEKIEEIKRRIVEAFLTEETLELVATEVENELAKRRRNTSVVFTAQVHFLQKDPFAIAQTEDGTWLTISVSPEGMFIQVMS